MSRIFAISDIHVDIPENLRLVESWSANDYLNDVLIVAGDVTDNLSLLKTVLTTLAQKFLKVCYVPGTAHIGEKLSNRLVGGGSGEGVGRKGDEELKREEGIAGMYNKVLSCPEV